MNPNASLPLLHGLRVVEFSAFVAAPSAGLTLAQMGAEVTRIDPLGGNIDRRRHPLNAEGVSLYWASLNRGKRSVELNVRSAEGRALMAQLICAGEGPPVFITNLGVDGELGYAALSAKRPDLIMVQLSGSPDGGNAVDYTVNSAVGIPLVTGPADRVPVNHVLPTWDVAAGLHMALAVVAAERHWQRTGQGQYISLALSDVAMATVANLAYLAEVEVNGVERQPDGNQLYGAYGDSFATQDARHVMVVALTTRQWEALLKATEQGPGLASAAAALGQDLSTDLGRYQARGLISTALGSWFARHSLAQASEALSTAGALWGPYRSFAQMLKEDPRCSPANPLFAQVHHPLAGTWLTAASPLMTSAATRLPPAPGPQGGQHTWEELARHAGLSTPALQALAQRGVIAAMGPV